MTALLCKYFPRQCVEVNTALGRQITAQSASSTETHSKVLQTPLLFYQQITSLFFHSLSLSLSAKYFSVCSIVFLGKGKQTSKHNLSIYLSTVISFTSWWLLFSTGVAIVVMVYQYIQKYILKCCFLHGKQ